MEYLVSADQSFDIDPADTDYQYGYAAAVIDILQFLRDNKHLKNSA